MIEITEELSQQVPVRQACQALGLPHAAFYRSRNGERGGRRLKNTPGSRRALLPEEKDLVRNTLNSERFADQAPREIYASLLDEGTYLCSVSTMYRILQEHQEVCERRDQLRHPDYAKPELLATAPNQVWTWDTPALACWCKCYKIARAGEVDLFLPVCTAGSFQSICGGLDAGSTRINGTRSGADH